MKTQGQMGEKGKSIRERRISRREMIMKKRRRGKHTRKKKQGYDERRNKNQ